MRRMDVKAAKIASREGWGRLSKAYNSVPIPSTAVNPATLRR
jgi:hypothetical protein